MTAWQLDDKEWVKSRKEHWKAIKPKLDMLINVEKSQQKLLKEYFLTGSTDDKLFTQISGYPLFQLWFDPDQSDDNWEEIKKKATPIQFANARDVYNEVVSNLGNKYAPDGSSFFDGLEERLFYIFGKHRLDKSDYPELDDRQFGILAKRTLKRARGINNYLNSENPHPFDTTRLLAKQWRDAMIIAFKDDYTGLAWLIESVDEILSSPSHKSENIVQLAKELDGYFDDPEFSDAAKKTIQKYRKKQ